MERTTRKRLAEIAREKSWMPFRGYLEEKVSK